MKSTVLIAVAIILPVTALLITHMITTNSRYSIAGVHPAFLIVDGQSGECWIIGTTRIKGVADYYRRKVPDYRPDTP